MTLSVQREDAPPPFLALLGAVAVAVAAGLTAYWLRPVRRSEAARRRDALVAYLRDHLSGSDLGLWVVSHLAETHPVAADRPFFARLARQFEEERSVVRSLLTQFGASGRSMKRAASYPSSALLMLSAGGEPGDLSLFRTLEGLAVGIQGKRCMWRALRDIETDWPSSTRMSFAELETHAIEQWEAVDTRRRALTALTFL